ncbi:hypothetical protein HNY73_017353 [Argiope bruennichi]|uniref:Uncharacterized protein n=1 Tax=Argiope bruennichi TaxID=94029 RepID=A0A8T0ELH2_ARGBR|nr:hypothetical protein HNY73_017353 [Argiope bruennichi]
MDLEFCEFYFKAIKKLVGNDGDRNCGFKSFRKSFQMLPITKQRCQFKSAKNTEIVDSLDDTLYNRIAWIYQNSTCLSSAIAYHFRKATMENSKVVNKLLKKKELRICSVSTGSPSDIVALVKVLESVVGTNEEIDIRVSIIHSDKKWKITCLVVLLCLERFKNALWKIDFIEGDFRFSCSNNLKQAIKNADIVSLVNYLGKFEDVEKRIQKNINVQYETAGNRKGEIPGYDLFYEAACDLHMLSVAAVVRHFQLYYMYLGSNLCNTVLKLFCRIWMKLTRKYPGYLNQKTVETKKRVEEQRAQCMKLTRECFLREQCYAWEVENYFKPLLKEISSKRKQLGWSKKESLKTFNYIKREEKEKIQILREKRAMESLEFQKLETLERELRRAQKEYNNLREKQRKIYIEKKGKT